MGRSYTHRGLLVLMGMCVVLTGTFWTLLDDSLYAQDKQIRRTPATEADMVTMSGEKRVALVVGNGSYESSALRNPPNDAKAMARSLRGLGFDVTEKVDLSKKEMKRAINDFAPEARKA